MKGLIGKKLGMTQLYNEKGVVTPVTVIQAGPCTVIDQMTVERNGYSAMQLGFGNRKAKNVSSAVKGHCEKSGKKETPPEIIREIRIEKDSDLTVGSVIKADIFGENEFVDVIGTSKGKGFQGVVRRYHFAGGRASHGGGWTRRPGSSGCRELPGNLIKNKRFPGHMGNEKTTTINLKVIKVDKDQSLLFVKGAVPGPNGGVVIVRSAKKKQSAKQGK